MSQGPVFGSVADKVNQYIAATDVREFTARDIANAIGGVKVNVVSAALSKLKSDKKITYRVIVHKRWGTPIHMYLNPREAGAMAILDKVGSQVPVVTPPPSRTEPLHVVRLGRREIVNPGCTRIVEGWIEKNLEGKEEIRFTTTLITKETGIPINRVSGLINTMRDKNKIGFVEKDGCRNVYFTTKRMFASYKRRRKVPTFVYSEAPLRKRDYIPEVREPGLVDHLLETAIKIEKTGATRGICVGLIETLCFYLRAVAD